jgi:amidase/aspartyl-tRNA(Asn)/glutamyl-tRNA(Gln) amidotransferase subunit A
MREVQRVFFGAPAPATASATFARLDARELAPQMLDAQATVLNRAAAAIAQELAPAELADLRRALDGAYHAYVVIQSSEAAAIHADWLDTRRADYDPAVWGRINSGRKWSADDIAAAHARQAEVRAMFARLFTRYAGLILPAAPFPALRKSECTDENRARVLQVTNAASHAGAPVLTIPVHLDDGTTNGLQVILPDYHPAALERLLQTA